MAEHIERTTFTVDWDTLEDEQAAVAAVHAAAADWRQELAERGLEIDPAIPVSSTIESPAAFSRDPHTILMEAHVRPLPPKPATDAELWTELARHQAHTAFGPLSDRARALREHPAMVELLRRAAEEPTA